MKVDQKDNENLIKNEIKEISKDTQTTDKTNNKKAKSNTTLKKDKTSNITTPVKKEKDLEADKTSKKENKDTKIESSTVTSEETNSPVDSEPKKKRNIFLYILVTIVVIFMICVIGFTLYNIFNPNIISGVSIKGIDVSGLSKSDARYQLEQYISDLMPEEITVKHEDFETTLSISQIEANFDLKTATNSAYNISRTGNIFQNNLTVLSTMFENVNIEPGVTVNKEQLSKNLEDLSAQLPDKVTQSSYYVEGQKLIITAGKEGCVVDVDASIEAIKNAISNLSTISEPIELVVKNQTPEEIDINKIYNEVHKEAKDASYTKNPFQIIPSENGVDFKISLDEAKALLANKETEEYVIPLKVIWPKVTTNMIGSEAFPDRLSTFSTNYAASNTNRSTNLMLAGGKINGTVLMPGETFSYNRVVGERTIAAGYKEAHVFVNGQTVDGLGGGICQITSTLYNAVLLANLQIVQRTNHQLLAGYVPASRDATVVYGAIDFQFKNNRNYPIKILCSVSGGVATCQIYGIKEADDCQVEISAYQTGKTATAIYSEAYRILKRNGAVVKRELLSKDVYKREN